MGLDITAYAIANRIGNSADEPGYGQANLCVAWSPHNQHDGLEPGLYEVTGEFDFRAGSYSGYNEFRNILAKSLGWDSAEACWRDDPLSKPLGKLINFGDNEGFFGPTSSAELAEQMRAHGESFVAYVATLPDDFSPEYRDYLKSRYTLFEKAFTLAANSGAVKFH